MTSGLESDAGQKVANPSVGEVRPASPGASIEPKSSELDREDSGPKVKFEVRHTDLFAFSNVEAIKERVRSTQLKEKPYNVHDRYHTKGMFQAIARHPYFENFTLGIIVLNAFWISVDTDNNTADTIIDARVMFVLADTMFFTYFSSELFIRFMAFEDKRHCADDFWFIFDSALVFLYAFDPFLIGVLAAAAGGSGLNLPTAVLRLFRLARLSRLVRMLRSLPELMIMIKGMVTAAKSVIYSLFLLMLIGYVFAIALRNLVPKDSQLEETFLPSVPETMHTLIIFATFLDDLAAYIVLVKETSTACLILSWVYIALASLTVMNMLIGVLCEVISAVAEEEKESMMVEKVKNKFDGLVKILDENHDGVISWDEFRQIVEMPDALQALDQVNVDAVSLVDLAEDFFFVDGQKQVAMSFDQFMELVLDLRGGQKATVKDIFNMGKNFSRKFLGMRQNINNIDGRDDPDPRTKTCLLDSINAKVGQLMNMHTLNV
jgi:hypothetical protein